MNAGHGDRPQDTPQHPPAALPADPAADPLARAAELRAVRERTAADVSIARRLGQIGVLGWLIVLPTLAGLFIGRWLDRSFATGIFFTAPLLMVGLALGCWIGWRWMDRG